MSQFLSIFGVIIVLFVLYYLWISIAFVLEWSTINSWKIALGFFIFIILVFWLSALAERDKIRKKIGEEKKKKEEKDKWERDHKAHYLLYLEVEEKRRRDEYNRRQREQQRAFERERQKRMREQQRQAEIRQKQELEKKKKELEKQKQKVISMEEEHHSWNKSVMCIQETNINLQQEIRRIERYVMELNIYDADFTEDYSQLLDYIDEIKQKNEIKL